MENKGFINKYFLQPRLWMAGDKGGHGDLPVQRNSKECTVTPFDPRGAGEWVRELVRTAAPQHRPLSASLCHSAVPFITRNTPSHCPILTITFSLLDSGSNPPPGPESILILPFWEGCFIIFALKVVKSAAPFFSPTKSQARVARKKE